MKKSSSNASLKPYCHIHEGEHSNGSWVYVEDDYQISSFHCCGDETYASRVEDNFCFPNKLDQQCKPIRGVQSGNTTDHKYFQAGGNACACDSKMDVNDTKVSLREKYIWMPNNCSLLKWDGDQFCSLLGDRVMLIVGDSTMMQAGVTLVNMLVSSRASCGYNVRMLRSDVLYRPSMHKICSDYDRMFRDVVEEVKPNISIFSTGAHLNDAGDVDAVLWGLRDFILEQTSVQNTSMIWKSQHPGHHDCDNFTEPLGWNDIQLNNGSTVSEDKYHWNTFRVMDEVVKEKLYAQNGTIFHKYYNRMKYMDLSMLFLRADGHPGSFSKFFAGDNFIDCLHFCMPGPLDLFPVLVLQMMYNKEI